jgi:hypothetical protein
VKLQYNFLDRKSDTDQEITLKIYGGMVAIHHAQTLKYGGLLDHDTGEALAALSRNYSITFKASLDEKASSIKRSSSDSCHSLRITLYGLHQDSDAVGTLLSENTLYLQQPRTYDSSAIYFNPQYLLRPGSDFKSVTQEELSSSVREKQMVPASKHQMLRVFDSAVGPATFSEVQVSKRLITDLKEYANLQSPFFTSPISFVAKFMQVSKESFGYDG